MNGRADTNPAVNAWVNAWLIAWNWPVRVCYNHVWFSLYCANVHIIFADSDNKLLIQVMPRLPCWENYRFTYFIRNALKTFSLLEDSRWFIEVLCPHLLLASEVQQPDRWAWPVPAPPRLDLWVTDSIANEWQSACVTTVGGIREKTHFNYLV